MLKYIIEVDKSTSGFEENETVGTDRTKSKIMRQWQQQNIETAHTVFCELSKIRQ